jgi:glycosyltransferase involved in cell wall biosynthesis
MKITVCVRTRDEERNIARFCRDYTRMGVDEILVADGGSTDDTVSIAKSFSRVAVREFPLKVWGKNNLWRNPECKHLNFLLDWAKEVESDWIIIDDCDSFPTRVLQKRAREIITLATLQDKTTILAHHIYQFGKTQWFPLLNQNTGFMWAWRIDNPLRARESEEWGIIWDNLPPMSNCYSILYPLALLHDYCPDPETVERKLKFYNENGMMSHTAHPLELGGALADMEDWMVDE